MIHLRDLLITLALPSLGAAPAAAQDRPPVATTHGEVQYGHNLFFQYQGASLAADKKGGIELAVDGHALSISFQEGPGAGFADVKEDGVTRRVAYLRDPQGRPDFSHLGQEDPFRRFYRNLPPAERTKVDGLKGFMANYLRLRAARPGDLRLTDCEQWTLFTLQMFVACPNSFGLGCLAAAYGIAKMFWTCM